jgi:hypothetical protein
LIWTIGAFAQGSGPDAPATGSDIVVRGYRPQTIKQDSDQIVDAVVAEDIGKLPDNNALEVLARITRVQVNRGSDEARGVDFVLQE